MRIRWSIIISFLLSMALTAVSFGQECLNPRPRFGDVYPDIMSVPLRTTFILGQRYPLPVYQFMTTCDRLHAQVVIDTNLRVVWFFWFNPPGGGVEPAGGACAGEEVGRYRDAVREWLLTEGNCREVSEIVCHGQGWFATLYERVYTDGDRWLGATAEHKLIYEPDTTYLRQAVVSGCRGEMCAYMKTYYMRDQRLPLLDVFSYDEGGRPLFDLLDSGQLPYDRRLYDPEVPANFRRWLEAALEECEP